jgi:hypothetical protein
MAQLYRREPRDVSSVTERRLMRSLVDVEG